LTSLAKGYIGGKPLANYTTYEAEQIDPKQNFISESKEVTNEGGRPFPGNQGEGKLIQWSTVWLRVPPSR
jgi:hypothetical protein